jgi:F0F1-type ATP synthase epsilon subunit
MRGLLDAAAFRNQAIDEQRAKQLIEQAKALLSQAHQLASP